MVDREEGHARIGDHGEGDAGLLASGQRENGLDLEVAWK
jgi:hypothetical protein